MKFTIVRLSGKCNQYLIDNLLETLRERSLTPHTFLLDFTEIKEIDHSIDHSLREFLSNPPTIFKIGISGLNDYTKELVIDDSNTKVPLFSTLEKGKEYYETINTSSKADSNHLRVVDYFRKGEHFYVYCPSCSVKLRIRAMGSHACPSCNSRFYFKPDLRKEGDDTTTKYEMLSLE
jgi:hypothetical protein